MPPPKPPVPRAARPKLSNYFDPWNSSSTGHQRAENQLGISTSWRESRSLKLGDQFSSGGFGGERISDAVGTGAEDWDEKLGALVRKEDRRRAECSVEDMLVKNEKVSGEEDIEKNEPYAMEDVREHNAQRKRGIFDGLVVYINGSTYPLVSDHKLKSMLVENGAKISIHLGRRKVTHIILGRPSGGGVVSAGRLLQPGSGGGLAGTKIQKEISRVGGCGIRYVGVEWVLECLKVGKRLSESNFANLKVAPKGQNTVMASFLRKQGPVNGPS